MRLDRIHIRDFQGIKALDLRLDTAVTLVAGRNGAGKTSLRDGIALALVGNLGRVGLKKEAPRLIRDGADAAVCDITDADGDFYQASITAAKLTLRGASEKDPVLPFVLDAPAFARLPADERRRFLYDLCGVKTEPADIHARLVARVFAGRQRSAEEETRVQRVLPLLRAGFEGACAEAKAQATAAKGAWKAATAETYGSEKAKTWRATVPPHDAAVAVRLATELKHCEAAAESWQRQVGALQAEDKRRAELRAKLPELKALADLEQRRRTKLEVDEETQAAAQRMLAAAAEAAGETPRAGLVHDLARALHLLLGDYFPEGGEDHGTPSVRIAAATLEAYARAHGPIGTGVGDPAAAQRLPELRHAADVAASAVANSQRDVDAALAARAEHERITAELAEAFDAAGLAEAAEQVDKLRAERVALQAKLDEQRSIKALVDGAEAKTKAAAGHHAAVVAWDAIADALSPDGIPGELLADALGPINERLALSAGDAGWPQVAIGADMAITAGGREYRLLSESEKWRCDAMLAEAVAQLSSTRLLLLDRFDVLDLPARAQALQWLDTLAVEREIDTAIVLGTLKAEPVGLPPTIGVHWIEAGVCGQMAEAA